MELPRVDVVFYLWQCDKDNHGWREGPPVTVPPKVPICWPGLHPPAKSISNEKRILLSIGGRQPLILNIGRYKRTYGAVAGGMGIWRQLPAKRRFPSPFVGSFRSATRR